VEANLRRSAGLCEWGRALLVCAAAGDTAARREPGLGRTLLKVPGAALLVHQGLPFHVDT